MLNIKIFVKILTKHFVKILNIKILKYLIFSQNTKHENINLAPHPQL